MKWGAAKERAAVAMVRAGASALQSVSAGMRVLGKTGRKGSSRGAGEGRTCLEGSFGGDVVARGARCAAKPRTRPPTAGRHTAEAQVKRCGRRSASVQSLKNSLQQGDEVERHVSREHRVGGAALALVGSSAAASCMLFEALWGGKPPAASQGGGGLRCDRGAMGSKKGREGKGTRRPGRLSEPS